MGVFTERFPSGNHFADAHRFFVIHILYAFFINYPTYCEHMAKKYKFQHLALEFCRKAVDFYRANMIQCCKLLL